MILLMHHFKEFPYIIFLLKQMHSVQCSLTACLTGIINFATGLHYRARNEYNLIPPDLITEGILGYHTRSEIYNVHALYVQCILSLWQVFFVLIVVVFTLDELYTVKLVLQCM
jgi:hypothetical protein